MVDDMRSKSLPLLELSCLLSLLAAGLAAGLPFLPEIAEPFRVLPPVLAAATALLAGAATWSARRRLRNAMAADAVAEETGGVLGEVEATLARLRVETGRAGERILALLEATARGEPAPVPLSPAEEAARGRIRAVLDGLARGAGAEEDCAGRFAAFRRICDELERGAARLVELRDRLGEATRESAEDMQSIAAAVEQLSAAVGEIGRNTSVSAEVARRCVGETQQSREEAERLGDAAGRIASIVETIRQIADQTTLLALNATIEAARAGTAGRSFAVVAGEVKALAQQTTAATEDIDRRIEQMKAAVEKVAGSIEVIMATANEADQATAAIATAVEQQSAVIDEIAQRLQRASDATRHIDRAVTRGEEDEAAGAHLETVARCIREHARQLAEAIEAEISSAAPGRAA